MNQQKQNSGQPQSGNVSPSDITPAIVEQFLSNQKQQLELQTKEAALKEKQLEINGKLAEKQIDKQFELLKDQPKQHRQNITRYGYIGGGFLIIILSFVGFCLYTGHEGFATACFKYGGYVLTTGLGYAAGRRNQKKSKSQNNENPQVEDVEEVED